MNNNKPHQINWEIISRYLSQEMDNDERIAFEKKMDADPQLSKIVDHAQGDWKAMQEMTHTPQKEDVDNAWHQLHNRFERDNLLPKQKITTIPHLSYSAMVRIAAMILIIIGGALITHQILRDTPMESQQTAYHEGGKIITLEDGSRVHLNGNSELKYPNRFSGKQRLVTLKGEAFFEITPNKKRPFVIAANNALVKVLGTTFNVNTHHKNVEVLVKSGVVKLSPKRDTANHVILKKGEFGIITHTETQLSTPPGPNYLAWKTRHLIFSGETMDEVARQINHAYQVNIEFKDDTIKKLRLTTTFNQQSLENIMESLCLTFHLKYEKNREKIILSLQ